MVGFGRPQRQQQHEELRSFPVASSHSSPASTMRARTLPSSASEPVLGKSKKQEILDSVDRLMAQQQERKERLHEAARQERLKEQHLRINQRNILTESMQAEQQQYMQELTAALRGHKERSAQKLKDSPFISGQAVFDDFDRGERDRGRSEYHAETAALREFRTTMNGTFTQRVKIGDPFADLRKEKRQLLEQEKQLKVLMEAERTREKMEGAARRRPSQTEDILAGRRLREDEKMMKEEFYRSLTGWNGKKVLKRNKPVKELWNEHKAVLAYQQVSAASSELLEDDADETFDDEGPEEEELVPDQEEDEEEAEPADGGGDGFVFVPAEAHVEPEPRAA